MSIKTANLTVSGTATLPATITLGTGSIVKSGAHALTLTTTATTNATFPTGNVNLAQLGAQSFSGLQTFSAGATISSGQTLTLTGATVAGSPTWSASQSFSNGLTAAGTTTLPATVNHTSAGAITKTGTGTLTLATGTDSSTISKSGTGSFTISTGVNNSGLTFSGAYTLTVSSTGTAAILEAQSFTGLQTFSAGATISSGQTLTLTGATVAGSPTWSASQSFSNGLTAAGTTTLPATVNYTGAGSVVKSGAHALTLTTTATTNATFPTGNVTLAALGTAQTFTADQTFSGTNGILTDKIVERTLNNGVSVGGVTLKGGAVYQNTTTAVLTNYSAHNIFAVGSYTFIEIVGVMNIVRSSGGNHNVSYKVRATQNAAGVWLVSDEFSEEILYGTLPIWDVGSGYIQLTTPNITNYTSGTFKFFPVICI